MGSDSIRTTATQMMTFMTADALPKARPQRRLKRAFGQRRDGRKRRACFLPMSRWVLRAAMRRGIRSVRLCGKSHSIDEFHLVRRPTLAAGEQVTSVEQVGGTLTILGRRTSGAPSLSSGVGRSLLHAVVTQSEYSALRTRFLAPGTKHFEFGKRTKKAVRSTTRNATPTGLVH